MTPDTLPSCPISDDNSEQARLFAELLAAVPEHEWAEALAELVAIADGVSPVVVSMTRQ